MCDRRAAAAAADEREALLLRRLRKAALAATEAADEGRGGCFCGSSCPEGCSSILGRGANGDETECKHTGCEYDLFLRENMAAGSGSIADLILIKHHKIVDGC